MKVGNSTYICPEDLPAIIPVFPLPTALLLPRADMPLNIFEPRYLSMVDAALAGNRIVGMIQPDDQAPPCAHGSSLCTVGCAGRITSFSETGDDRYVITLTGIARFQIVEEVSAPTPYRQCRITTAPYGEDFSDCVSEEFVDRHSVLTTFRAYLDAHNLETDWESVDSASNETLINALAMMAPFDAAEKQALLEAPNLKSRAETLVAITEMSLARQSSAGSKSLQ
jgi:uncharacterized protein